MTENDYQLVKSLFLAGSLAAIVAMAAKTVMLEDELSFQAAHAGGSIGMVSTSLQIALGHIEAIETDTQRTEAEMAGLLNQTRHSMMTPAQTKELVDRAANLMDNANLATIRLGEAAQSLQGIGPTVQGAVAQVAQDVHTSAQQSTAMMKAATDDLADPALKEIADHIDATSGNVEATSQDVKKIADEWAAPIKGFWNHLKAFAFEVAGPAASVATAIK